MTHSPQNGTKGPIGHGAFRAMDRMRQAMTSELTGGISPIALSLAYADWTMHLASSPGRMLELAQNAANRTGEAAMSQFNAQFVDKDTPPAVAPGPHDHRFRGAEWDKQPFRCYAEAFLLIEELVEKAARGVPGVSPHHEDVVSFATRQFLDVFSPSNLPFANPAVLKKTMETGGQNFAKGLQNWWDDVSRAVAGRPPAGAEDYVVGRNVAATPGRVVYRNHLMELIQYEPTTETVKEEPILIVPAWIMKYYILDLEPQNSLVRFLVDKGHTVFVISWRNPTAEDRDLELDDYRRLGVMKAIDAIGRILPDTRIHATGYCLGGTLLSIAAAAMARQQDDRLASVTLLAAQTDFTEPGELALFIDHSQMEFLESVMWSHGYLSDGQMSGAFQLLRSNDLVWSRLVHDYMMGERTPVNALMAWNADTTRMPFRMHSQYLRQLYLDNDLAAGRLMVDNHPVALQNIRAPLFVVGTESDHVAPWTSVFKIHQLVDTNVTFVLTSRGHNAGIVSEPGHPGRHYRITHKRADSPCIGHEEWLRHTDPVEGSWWAAWNDWLDTISGDEMTPPPMGAADKGYPPLEDAPGTYVFQR
ncbi:MAG: PHA/PHB synthase family protein [Paracoccaceae bacterium]